MTGPSKPWLRPCNADATIMEKTGLDRFALLRLRQEFHRTLATMDRAERQRIESTGVYARLAVMVNCACHLPETWERWLTFLDYPADIVYDMCAGTVYIGPYAIDQWSALYGIESDWLRWGLTPKPARSPVNL